MSDQASNEIPDFDFSLDGVDTSFPVPAAGTYVAQVSFTVEKQKEGSGRNLVVKALLLGEVLSHPNDIDGSQKQLTDVSIVSYLPLQAKAGAKDPEMFKKNIAMLVDAILGTDMTNRPAKPDWNAMQNSTVMVSTSVENTDKFGRQARIDKWIHQASGA